MEGRTGPSGQAPLTVPADDTPDTRDTRPVDVQGLKENRKERRDKKAALKRRFG